MTMEELELVKHGKRWRKARDQEREAAEHTYESIRRAVASGTSEVQAAELAQVDRMTVRRALGKR